MDEDGNGAEVFATSVGAPVAAVLGSAVVIDGIGVLVAGLPVGGANVVVAGLVVVAGATVSGL